LEDLLAQNGCILGNGSITHVSVLTTGEYGLIRDILFQSPELKFEKIKRDSRGLMVGLDLVEWAKDKQEVWDRVVEKYGGKREASEWAGWGHLNWTMGRAATTLLCLEKTRKFGWTRYDSTYDSWVATYKVVQLAGILPNRHPISID
jgi:hypothetical protein